MDNSFEKTPSVREQLRDDWKYAKQRFEEKSAWLGGLVLMKKRADESRISLADIGGSMQEFMTMCKEFATENYAEVRNNAQKYPDQSMLGSLTSLLSNLAYVGLTVQDAGGTEIELKEIQKILAEREIRLLRNVLLSPDYPITEPILTVSNVAGIFARGGMKMEDFGLSTVEALELMYQWSQNFIQYMSVVANNERLLRDIDSRHITALAFAFQNAASLTNEHEDVSEGFRRKGFRDQDEVLDFFRMATKR